MQEGLGNSYALLHAAGKSTEKLVTEFLGVGDLEAVIDPIGVRLSGKIVCGSKEVEIFPDAQGGIDAEVIGKEADELLDAVLVAGDVLPGDQGAAFRWFQ